MAYTNVWNEAAPPGSQQASTAASEYRKLKVDFRERINSLLGVAIGTALSDPICSGSVLMTDLPKTITATLTFTPNQIFSSTINGQTISSAASFTGSVTAVGDIKGSSVTINGGAATSRVLQYTTSNTIRILAILSDTAESGGNAGSDYIIKRYNDAGAFLGDALTITRSSGLVTIASGLTVTTNGVSITAGGLTVTAGGALITAGGLTVSAGGAAITGTSTVTGNLTVTGTLTATGTAVSTRQTSDATTTSVTPANTSLIIPIGSSESWVVEYDLGISCDNTGGTILNITTPAGAVIRANWIGATSSRTALDTYSQSDGASPRNWSQFNSSAGPVPVKLSCYVATTGTSGNITLQISAGTAGQTSKLYTGSTAVAVRIS